MEMEFWQYPPDPNQRSLSEEELIHALLNYVATKLPEHNLQHLIDPTWVFVWNNIDAFKNFAMHRMVAEGLITTESSRHSSAGVMVKATPHGVRVARAPGGYRAHLAASHQIAAQDRRAKFESERLTREAAQATIDAAEATRLSVQVSERAIRISKIGSVVSALIAIAAIVAQVITSNDTAADLAIAKRQIKELQQQVELLSKRR